MDKLKGLTSNYKLGTEKDYVQDQRTVDPKMQELYKQLGYPLKYAESLRTLTNKVWQNLYPDDN